MRLVRLGADTSRIGADVRAALTSWGPRDAVLGGIALLGVPPGQGLPSLDAILVLPRGVIVVAGVDLPEPAMRLDAPLGAQWKADGWPLATPYGAVNPAGDALTALAVVTERLRSRGVEPVSVGTIIAVGPFVSQVAVPAADLDRGVRVLHPTPMSMLAAARELTANDRPGTIEHARTLLSALVDGDIALSAAELAAEGFVDPASPGLAAANPIAMPRVEQPEVTHSAETTSPRLVARRTADSGQPQWLPILAALLVGALLLTAIGVAIGSSGQDPTASSASFVAPPPQVADIMINGVRFSPEGSTEGQDCATHSFGQIKVWLAQHACTTLIRSVYQTTANGQPAAIAVTVVGFADSASARSFASVVQTPGSGGMIDLITDGDGWAGGPKSFTGAASIFTVQDISVRQTEAVWIGRPSDPNDPDLRSLVERSAGLPGIP